MVPGSGYVFSSLASNSLALMMMKQTFSGEIVRTSAFSPAGISAGFTGFCIGFTWLSSRFAAPKREATRFGYRTATPTAQQVLEPNQSNFRTLPVDSGDLASGRPFGLQRGCHPVSGTGHPTCAQVKARLPLQRVQIEFRPRLKVGFEHMRRLAPATPARSRKVLFRRLLKPPQHCAKRRRIQYVTL